jgi:hypothetical protein
LRWNDEASVQKFRETLCKLGANIAEDGWAIGVTIYRVQIGREFLMVFSNTWSLDVEGPDEWRKESSLDATLEGG